MIKYNFDKFVDGKIRLLFIFGYSGSGKTTLTAKLASKYNCNITILENDVQDCYKRLKDLLIKTSTKQDTSSYIIDGIQLLPLYETKNSFLKHELWNYSFIILEDNIKDSLKRRLARDYENLRIRIDCCIKSYIRILSKDNTLKFSLKKKVIGDYYDFTNNIISRFNPYKIYKRYTYDKRVLNMIKDEYNLRKS